jgi:translation initiation factor 3 subunit A
MKEVNTDILMKMQVEQMEKEKKDLNDKLRMVSKRIDHLERAFRKEERPLLADDYAKQQADDKKTFEELRKARIEGSRTAHEEDVTTKHRLARMMDDYQVRSEIIAARRGEDFAKKREKAFRKIEEEKAKRRATVLKQREEERIAFEEEERIAREEEEEAARLEEGTILQLLNTMIHR